ncbi:hypothetical protein [Niabella aquatica]
MKSTLYSNTVKQANKRYQRVALPGVSLRLLKRVLQHLLINNKAMSNKHRLYLTFPFCLADFFPLFLLYVDFFPHLLKQHKKKPHNIVSGGPSRVRPNQRFVSQHLIGMRPDPVVP